MSEHSKATFVLVGSPMLVTVECGSLLGTYNSAYRISVESNTPFLRNSSISPYQVIHVIEAMLRLGYKIEAP